MSDTIPAALNVANRALWRLPFPRHEAGGVVLKLGLLLGALGLGPGMAVSLATRRIGAVCALTNGVMLLSGWFSVCTGIVGEQSGGPWSSWNPVVHRGPSELPDGLQLMFWFIRPMLGLASVVATGISTYRLATWARGKTEISMYEAGLCVLSVADLPIGNSTQGSGTQRGG